MSRTSLVIIVFDFLRGSCLQNYSAHFVAAIDKLLCCTLWALTCHNSWYYNLFIHVPKVDSTLNTSKPHPLSKSSEEQKTGALSSKAVHHKVQKLNATTKIDKVSHKLDSSDITWTYLWICTLCLSGHFSRWVSYSLKLCEVPLCVIHQQLNIYDLS